SMKLVGTARRAVRIPPLRRDGVLTLEKGSAPPVRIPSLWAESGPSPRCLFLAIWRNETNSFAQLGFLFSRTWEFQQQWDLASERSRHPAPVFSLIATQIDRSTLPQRGPRPGAFLQASVWRGRVFFARLW